MNRTCGLDVSFNPDVQRAAPDTRRSQPAAIAKMVSALAARAIIGKAAKRIAAGEPELTAVVVIAPFVIAVLAALPTFVTA